jgi:hypothetical protein
VSTANTSIFSIHPADYDAATYASFMDIDLIGDDRQMIELLKDRPEFTGLAPLTAGEHTSTDPLIEVVDGGWGLQISWEFPSLTTDLGEHPHVYLEIRTNPGALPPLTRPVKRHYTSTANVRYRRIDGSGVRYTYRCVRDWVTPLPTRNITRRTRRGFVNYAADVLTAFAGSPQQGELLAWVDSPAALDTDAFTRPAA